METSHASEMIGVGNARIIVNRIHEATRCTRLTKQHRAVLLVVKGS